MNDANQHPLISSPHRLKLAVFGLNVGSGCSMTRAPGTLQITAGQSKRIGPLVLFLASHYASAVTGQTIAIDGGATASVIY